MTSEFLTRCLAAIAILCAVTAANGQTIVYVDDDAPPCGDGQSWETAYRYVRDALDDPANPKEIRVAQGTYYPDESCAVPNGTGITHAPWFINSAVAAIRGGFGGLAVPPANQDDQDPALYATVLDGDLDENDDLGLYGDNIVWVMDVHMGGEGLIEGFIIRGGNARGAVNDGGGGLSITVGVESTISRTIRQCTFIDNRTEKRSGGALYAAVGAGVSNAVITIDRCRFHSNESTAPDGGGAIGLFNTGARIRNCIFNNNLSTPQRGGAITVKKEIVGGNVPATTHITNCLFHRNTTAAGEGSAVMSFEAPVEIQNSVFWFNFVGGGGHQAQVSGSDGLVPVSVTACVIESVGVPPGALGPFVTGVGNHTITPAPDWVDPDGADNVYGTIDDDYHLVNAGPGATLVDDGNNTLIPSGMLVDLDGAPRTVDGDGDRTATIDVGPYEYIPGCPFCPGARTWFDPVDGDFNVDGNWDIGVPSEVNVANFMQPGTYTVGFDGATVESLAVHVTAGDVTFDLEGGSYELSAAAQPALIITNADDSSAALTVTGAGMLSGPAGDAVIGDGLGSDAMLTVTGDGMGNAPIVINDDLLIGAPGFGRVDILDGGTVANLRANVGGDVPGARGDVLVSGTGSLWDIVFFAQIFNGSVTVENEATIQAGLLGGLFVFESGVLTGDGTIVGDVVNFGTVEPGLSPGTLTINGNYVQVGAPPFFNNLSGTLRAEIAGTVPGMFDELQVTGTAQLGGGLFVELDGYDPAEGDTFSILSAGTVLEQFDVAFFPGLPDIDPDDPTDNRYMRITTGPSALGGGEAVTVTVDTLENLFDLLDAVGQDVPGAPTAVAIANVDETPGDDLVITLLGATPGVSPGSILLLLNDGMGGFMPQQITDGIGIDPRGVVAADLDGDGLPDLAVSNSIDGTVTVLDNTGGASFTAQAPIPAGTDPRGIAAGRFVGDTALDLVVANAGDDTVTIYENDGAGTGWTSLIVTVGHHPLMIDPETVDDDKDIDAILVALSEGDGVSVLINNGDDTFGRTDLPAGQSPVDVLGGDLDNDGYSDIVTANFGDGTVSVFRNLGTAAPGQFAPAVNLPVGDEARSVTLIDLDSDGDLDIAVVANGDDMPGRIVQVLRNDLPSPGGQLGFASADELFVGSDPILVSVGQLDGDGEEDLVAVNEGLGVTAPATAPGPASVSDRASRRDGQLASTFGPPMMSVNVVLREEPPPPPVCPGDTNANDVVDVDDLNNVILDWGTDGSANGGDIVGPGPGDPPDGAVDVNDLNAVIVNWGLCP